MKDRRSKRHFLLLALILLAGALLRFYGLRTGFPFAVHVDEWFNVEWPLGIYRTGDWKPRTFAYPSLIFYLLAACAHLFALVWREPTFYELNLLGRALSAASASATVLVVYLTGRRAYNHMTGLLAAAFLAFTVTALREAHYYTPDSINVLFIALGVHYCVRVGLDGRRRDYLLAGLFTGLAAGTKYNGALLAVPLLFAHLARVRDRAGAVQGHVSQAWALASGLFSPLLIAAGVTSLLAFLATTPYALLSPGDFFKDFSRIGPALNSKLAEGNHHYIGTTPYWYYVENLLFWAMGPALETACLLGFFYALWRHRRQDFIIALWVVVYFAAVGGWLNKAARYTLPLLPFLALFGARVFVEAHARLRAAGRRGASVCVVVLAALTLSSAALYSLAYMNVFREPHAVVEAVRWARENVPEGATVLLEGPTPHERPQLDGAVMVYADDSFDFRRFRFKYLEVPKFSDPSADPALLRAELEATLEGVDYIFMTTRWYEGLARSPAASPVIKEYYRQLTSGESGFEPAREIVVRPRLLCFEVNDDGAELNFRIFDHPKIWVFKRAREGRR